MRISHAVVFTLFLLALSMTLAAPAFAGNCFQPPVQLRQIGHPIWKPVDFHLFSAYVGTADNGYAGFGQNMTNLLYPLRHQDCGGIGRGPGDPHQPPYDKEMMAGLEVMSFTDKNVFGVAEFSNPNGVWATWMNVPAPGVTGSSPDFVSGPVIPNTLFPIHLIGEVYRNNQLWDPYFGTFDVPPLDSNLPPPICLKGPVDGHSHFPIFYFENADFNPGGPVSGHYELRVTMTDVTGNGWSITIPYTVQ